mgnify:CR=1 FL=1
MTMAFDPDLDDAVIALRDMIKLICGRTGLSRARTPIHSGSLVPDYVNPYREFRHPCDVAKTHLAL